MFHGLRKHEIRLAIQRYYKLIDNMHYIPTICVFQGGYAKLYENPRERIFLPIEW